MGFSLCALLTISLSLSDEEPRGEEIPTMRPIISLTILSISLIFYVILAVGAFRESRKLVKVFFIYVIIKCVVLCAEAIYLIAIGFYSEVFVAFVDVAINAVILHFLIYRFIKSLPD